MAGCSGCELWIPARGVKKCYAGVLTERYGGRPGWPPSFDQPTLFPGRIEEACRWPDLTGRDRPDKPWLNGLPRLIFLDDMGDTFDPKLPRDWLLPHVPAMEQSPHIWLFLTKQAGRMRQFFERLGYVPENFWLGVTITSDQTRGRLNDLWRIREAPVRWVSYEPALGPFDLSGALGTSQRNVWLDPPRPGRTWRDEYGIHWLVVGGESGPGAEPLDLQWVRRVRVHCRDMNVRLFVKQLGSAWAKEAGSRDAKGEEWSRWPEDLRIREMPEVKG